MAGLLIFLYKADVTRLIQLYIIGVFTSFTLGQSGMVRHWNRALRSERDPGERRRIVRSRAINGFGASLAGVVLVIVIITKFSKGAYLVLIAMPILYGLMRAINRHYTRVSEELTSSVDVGLVLPARNHVVVLVSKLHKPALRALAYARATRPDTLTALTVNVNDEDTRALLAEWERRDLPVRLTVLESPYREISKPIMNYVRQLRADRPHDVVSIFIPEYVVGHWWEQLLHNQTALRLKGRLLFQQGVMVTSVPWQLDSTGDRVEGTNPIRADHVRAARQGPPGWARIRRSAARDAPCPRLTPGRRSAPPSSSRSGRSRTAGPVWPGTTAGWSSSGTACPARRSARS